MIKKIKKSKIGWTIRGKPFSPKEFSSSILKSNSGKSFTYDKYLKACGRAYKKRKCI